ncbi:MAG: hypothetical protein EOP53_07985 [Sphingobacteriales bacterium]|nr:MAG: hypothetical protein EOP53_07985 [Sphingobacteriales bacterium]
MKKFTLIQYKNILPALFFVVLFMSSCSRETAFVSNSEQLAYEQAMAPKFAAPNTVNTLAEEKTALVNTTPVEKETVKEQVVSSVKSNKTKALASIHKIKANAPLKLKEISKEKLSVAPFMASVAKGKVKKQLEISGKLRIGLILILIGFIFYFIPGLGFIGWILQVIGAIFLILWLLEEL